MRKISFFLAVSTALCTAACGHQPSASQQTAQVAEASQVQPISASQQETGPAPTVQLAAATVEPAMVPGQDFYPESDYQPEPEGGYASNEPRPLPPGYVYAMDLRDPYAHGSERCQDLLENARERGVSREEVIQETLAGHRAQVAQCF